MYDDTLATFLMVSDFPTPDGLGKGEESTLRKRVIKSHAKGGTVILVVVTETGELGSRH